MTLSSLRDMLKSLGISSPHKRMTGIAYPIPKKKAPPRGWTIHCEPTGNIEVWRR